MNTGDNHQGPGWLRVVKLLSSMQAALFLLLVTGALASLGSLIPQGEPGGFYREHYGNLLGRFIILLTLDDMYRSWWFMALGALFVASILSCSARRLGSISGAGDLGSVLLHLGLPVIIMGAFFSAAAGRSTYLEIGAGDSADLSSQGFPGVVITVQDFKIDYYDNLEPRQYTSAVTVQGGGTRSTGETSVNHPLKAGGIKVFQKSYGWIADGEVDSGRGKTKFSTSGQDIELEKAGPLKLKAVFIPDYVGVLQSGSPLPRNPRLACALVNDSALLDMQIFKVGEIKNVGGFPVSFTGYRYYTGLEIKKDPAVTVIYTGFMMMAAGFAVRKLFRGWDEKEVA